MDDVDEDRLEALALQLDLSAETKYEKRGASWYCWLAIAGDARKFLITWAHDMPTKQMVFDSGVHF